MASLVNKWVTLILAVWIVLVIYLMMSSSKQDTGSAMSENAAERLNQALSEMAEMKLQNEQLRKLASELKELRVRSLSDQMQEINHEVDDIQSQIKKGAVVRDVSPDSAAVMGALRAEVDKLRQQVAGGGGSPPQQLAPFAKAASDGSDPETLRRRAENGVFELGFYVDDQLNRLQRSAAAAGAADVATGIARLAANAAAQRRTVLNDLRLLSDAAAEWRQKEHSELTDIVQSRIYQLQNPSDCSKAKKLVCNLNKGCGYGCQLHHAIYCFMIAYGTGRTMVLQSTGWRYAGAGWESVFQPLSIACASPPDQHSAPMWRGEAIDSDKAVVALPIVDGLGGRPPYMPLSIPEDLAPRLTRLHGHPAVWFIGQFVRYMVQPQRHLEDLLRKTYEAMGYKKPIVGVHVRRTDKVGTEAQFHGIAEYMVHVDAFYDRLELHESVDARRVYLASDDPEVLAEARQKYPKYVFIGDVSISKSAGLDQRYGEASLQGVIKDIHFLSLSDYLVCTFSSQVCRVAYEIMNTMHPDASTWFHSLDDIYYFGGQNAHEQIAMYAHTAQNNEEIDLQPGDVVGVAGNHWNGYSKGQNRRTGRIGLYPSYKVKDKTVIIKYPTYLDVNVTHHEW